MLLPHHVTRRMPHLLSLARISRPPALLRTTVISCLLAGIFSPPAIHAQVIASPTATRNKQAHIVAPDRGPTVVQIAKPNQSGLSHNQYQQFNVDRSGLILSNNKNNVDTQLRSVIASNPNLVNSAPATIILNEVVSRQKSFLNGPIEVAGSKADVVISNPNGISVNGLELINANRTMLTTGVPTFGGSGSLDTFKVIGGHIDFEGKGMQDPRSSRTDIVARSIKVNADIWAKELTMVTGNNKVAYEQMILRQIDGKETHPVVALDVAELGGMYANKIRLIGTESGVGVKDYGEVMLSADDFSMSDIGKIDAPQRKPHRISKHDTSDSDSDSDDNRIPTDIASDVINQINEIDFPDDNAVTPSGRPTNDHLIAAAPLPIYQRPASTSNESPERVNSTPLDLSALPLVGGPLGLIPSPEQGSPLDIIPAQDERPMAVMSHARAQQEQHPNDTTWATHAPPPPPPYGWDLMMLPPIHHEHYTPSFSFVPVGEAPRPNIPLGIVPITDHAGHTRFFLPPKVYGANLTKPVAPTRYEQTPQQHGNESWNQPGPSGVVAPHLDEQTCAGSRFSCTAGQPIPSTPSDIWPDDIMSHIQHETRKTVLPPHWTLDELKRHITQRVASPYSHWKHNNEMGLLELRTRLRSRHVSVFFDPLGRRIHHIVIAAPRANLPRPRPQTPVTQPVTLPLPDTTSSDASDMIDITDSQIERPPTSSNDMSNDSASWDLQIETPPSNQPPPTPGKDPSNETYNNPRDEV